MNDSLVQLWCLFLFIMFRTIINKPKKTTTISSSPFIVLLVLLFPSSPADCIRSLLYFIVDLIVCCVRFPSSAATRIAEMCYIFPNFPPLSRLIVALFPSFSTHSNSSPSRIPIDCCVVFDVLICLSWPYHSVRRRYVSSIPLLVTCGWPRR